MPIVRFEPGAQAPRAGTYDLCGEWGERVGESVTVNADDVLPLVDAHVNPRWYVLVGVPSSPDADAHIRARKAMRIQRASAELEPQPTRVG
jgi:hypothetical protein